MAQFERRPKRKKKLDFDHHPSLLHLTSSHHAKRLGEGRGRLRVIGINEKVSRVDDGDERGEGKPPGDLDGLAGFRLFVWIRA